MITIDFSRNTGHPGRGIHFKPMLPLADEPLIALMTLGIVPIVRVEAYKTILDLEGIAGGSTLLRLYRTTETACWIVSPLIPLPGWKSGKQNRLANDMKRQVIENVK